MMLSRRQMVLQVHRIYSSQERRACLGLAVFVHVHDVMKACHFWIPTQGPMQLDGTKNAYDVLDVISKWTLMLT